MMLVMFICPAGPVSGDARHVGALPGIPLVGEPSAPHAGRRGLEGHRRDRRGAGRVEQGLLFQGAWPVLSAVLRVRRHHRERGTAGQAPPRLRLRAWGRQVLSSQ